MENSTDFYLESVSSASKYYADFIVISKKIAYKSRAKIDNLRLIKLEKATKTIKLNPFES